MPHLPLAPLASGTWQAGRRQTAAHWLCRGLRIATGARPPRLTCGATGVSLWAAPGRGKTARRGCLGDRSNRSVRSCLRTSRRALPRRSLGQERTCHAGYEVVKVKRHSLLRAKIVEDRLNDQALLFGQSGQKLEQDFRFR